MTLVHSLKENTFLEAETGAKVNRYEITIKDKTAEVAQKAVAEVLQAGTNQQQWPCNSKYP